EAEAARARRAAVMRAARGVVGERPLEGEARGVDRAADARRRALEDAGEERVLQGADGVALARSGIDPARLRGAPQGGDVAAVVEAEELVGRCARARHVLAFGEPIERIAQV